MGVVFHHELLCLIYKQLCSRKYEQIWEKTLLSKVFLSGEFLVAATYRWATKTLTALTHLGKCICDLQMLIFRKLKTVFTQEQILNCNAEL